MTTEDWKLFDEKSDADIAADVAGDPDSAPVKMSAGASRSRPLSLVKLIRQKLRLSREQFSTIYGIPLDTLSAWERHESAPSTVEETYLRLIEREPERARLVSP